VKPIGGPRCKVGADRFRGAVCRMNCAKVKPHSLQQIELQFAPASSPSSTLRASAAINKKPFRTARNGSGDRNRPAARSRKTKSGEDTACTQFQAEGTSALASRTTWPPRQRAMAMYRGRPRPPPPFTRVAKRTIEALSGNLSLRPSTSAACDP
jgi:hypothetical protein